jgi:dTMP kinase
LNTREETVPPSAELLLMFAARAVHLANRIEPCLRAGEWVLCDRFTDATYAYQGAGRGLPQGDIGILENMVQGPRRPDLTLLLDAPVDLALQRVRNRRPGVESDRFERERAEFFERVRAGYLERAAAAPDRILVIDASASQPEVSAAILAQLEARSWIS